MIQLYRFYLTVGFERSNIRREDDRRRDSQDPPPSTALLFLTTNTHTAVDTMTLKSTDKKDLAPGVQMPIIGFGVCERHL